MIGEFFDDVLEKLTRIKNTWLRRVALILAAPVFVPLAWGVVIISYIEEVVIEHWNDANRS